MGVFSSGLKLALNNLPLLLTWAVAATFIAVRDSVYTSLMLSAWVVLVLLLAAAIANAGKKHGIYYFVFFLIVGGTLGVAYSWVPLLFAVVLVVAISAAAAVMYIVRR